jgi:hypothetical protein
MGVCTPRKKWHWSSINHLQTWNPVINNYIIRIVSFEETEDINTELLPHFHDFWVELAS